MITRIFSTILLVANLTFMLNVNRAFASDKLYYIISKNDFGIRIEPSKKGPRKAGQGSSKYWLFIYNILVITFHRINIIKINSITINKSIMIAPPLM